MFGNKPLSKEVSEFKCTIELRSMIGNTSIVPDVRKEPVHADNGCAKREMRVDRPIAVSTGYGGQGSVAKKGMNREPLTGRERVNETSRAAAVTYCVANTVMY